MHVDPRNDEPTVELTKADIEAAIRLGDALTHDLLTCLKDYELTPEVLFRIWTNLLMLLNEGVGWTEAELHDEVTGYLAVLRRHRGEPR